MFQSTTTKSTYSLKLQSSIEQEADSALSRLDDLIQTKGYEWLHDYMEGVNEAVAKGGRRNAAQAGSSLVNILKTPSRTPRMGTAKKTRTVLAKEKDKENRLRLANAELKTERDEISSNAGPSRAPNARSILFATGSASGEPVASGSKNTKKPQPIVIKDASNPFVETTIQSLPVSVAAGSSSNKAIILSVPRDDPSNRDRTQPSISQLSQKHHIRTSRADEPEIAMHYVTQQTAVVTSLLRPETSTKDASIHSARIESSEINTVPEKKDLEHTRNTTPDELDSRSSLPSVTPKLGEETDDENSDIAQPMSLAQSARPEGQAAVVTASQDIQGSASPVQANNAVKTSLSVKSQAVNTDTEDFKASQQSSSASATGEAQTTDYSVPLKDVDILLLQPSSPTGLSTTASKSPFSPSAVTFAALPTRDLPRGRSIGATKHQRMTSHMMESTVPEIQAVNTPGPIATSTYQAPKEHASAASKAARDSKSGGTGAGSSWISRKVLAGSGAEDLRKSLAVSKRPSTADPLREDETDDEADEVQEIVKRGTARASEAVTGQQRFSLASKTPQPLAHTRQTLGASTMSRPTANSIATPFVDQPQSNLSKMIADLQEKRAVASFNASVTRATLPSLQLGRGAQGIATMGISSGLLGRSAIQSSLDRAKVQNSQAAAPSESLDVFDERPKDLARPSDVDLENTPMKDVQAGCSVHPSTTEELNQAVDEILRKISTEREMAQVQEIQLEVPSAEDLKDDGAEETLSLASARLQVKTPTSVGPNTMSRTASVRAEEQEVEELTKRTHTLSINSREILRQDSVGRNMPGSSSIPTSTVNSVEKVTVKRPVEEDTKPESDDIPVSTTPVNSPPRLGLYRPSLAHILPPPKPNLAKLSITQNTAAPRERATPQPTVSGSSKAVFVSKPSSAQTRQQPANLLQQKPTDSQNGLSRSQAVAIDEEDSDSSVDDSESEDMIGHKRFDDKEDLAEEVARLAKPLNLSDRSKHAAEYDESSDSDAESVEEVGSNGTDSRAPSRNGAVSLASSTTTNALSASTTTKSGSKAYLHTPANIARLIDGQKAPAGPINSILKAQQRKAEEEARRAKRVANKEAIERRKQDERQAKIDETRAKEEADKKARLERLRKQKAEREKLEKKRQEQEAFRATESFTKDRAISVEPSGSKATLNQSLGAKRMLAPSKTPKPAGTVRAKETIAPGGTLQASTSRPPSRVSALPSEIKGAAGAMRPPMPRTNTNPSTIAFQPAPASNLLAGNAARETNPRASTFNKQPPPLTTSINANNSDIRAVRPNKKPSIIPSQKVAPPRQRESTMKPTRETMKPGMNVVEFQRMVALGGKTPANMRSEDIELSDIGSDFGYESDSSESNKGEVIPAWAQSPALKKAAALQEKINPSHLFGAMPEFKMESVFDTKAARRPRSSSANWTGQDRLTEQEKLEYTKKMGYRSIDDLALIAMNMGANS
ncbi:hypothetical protein QFC24_004150 [Naganishia onofrii]|uniref:Uncharacterized protein n=1 Tax=Naganishia onofrii TaxID=1851511 RepID=A0ACC2XGF6_9TREE|nr:hypothetical protein QFC24_004150 [Naganishia onofrii]